MTELKIINKEQAVFYMKHNILPIRVELGFKDKIVYVFTKESTQELFGEWLKVCELKRAYKNKLK